MDFIILDSSPNYEELKPVVAAADKIFYCYISRLYNFNDFIEVARLAKEQDISIGVLL